MSWKDDAAATDTIAAAPSHENLLKALLKALLKELAADLDGVPFSQSLVEANLQGHGLEPKWLEPNWLRVVWSLRQAARVGRNFRGYSCLVRLAAEAVGIVAASRAVAV